MRVLISGGEGQLGSQFAGVLRPSHECFALGRRGFDVTEPSQVRDVLRRVGPELVVHCAAWTDVDGCEDDPERAHRVNAEGTRTVAEAAASFGVRLVYVSTDFVFDGTKPEPYTEDDTPNPINVYGRSKLAGEAYVRELCPEHHIVRTAWLFGPSPGNFVGRILAAARQRDELRVAHDQVGSPTHVGDLAAKIAEMVGRAPFGTYHVTNRGEASRHRWASEIVRIAGLDVPVVPISASEWSTPAARPGNSRLDNKALRDAGMAEMRAYEDALAEVVPALLRLSPAG